MTLIARLTVRSVRRLSPSFVRVEFGGDDLAELGVDGPPYDQRIKLVFPGPSGRLPELGPDSSWSDYRALPEDQRGVMRTYTIRAARGTGADTVIVVDFVVHEPPGPASRWALEATPGGEVVGLLPRRGEPGAGIEWAPPGRDRLLLVGDESAVPAACSILEALPPDATGAAFLEVPEAPDVQPVRAPAGVSVRWLPRAGAPVGELISRAVGTHLGLTLPGASPGERVDPNLWETPTFSSSGEAVAGVDGAGEPPGPPPALAGGYAWIAGEAGMVTALRRELVRGLGLPRHRVAFMGYWRVGATMHV